MLEGLKNMGLNDSELEEVSGGKAIKHNTKDDTCIKCNGTGSINFGKRPVPCDLCGGTGKKK